MKGLLRIPSVADLSVAYEKLQLRGARVTPEDLALWAQWARFDPRLAEQLVAHLARRWGELNPLRLRDALLAHPWPQAFGVLVEQVGGSGLLPREGRGVFRQWGELALFGVEPACGELFFIGTRKLAGKQMFLDAARPIRSYTRWGYLGRDVLVNKAAARARQRTLHSPAVRRRVLKDLMKSRSRFTVRDYLEALDNQVSRRQAELDLAGARGLVAVGSTRARFYRVRRG